MWVYSGVLPSREQLAEGACWIEIERLRRPIGRQDQYAAAYGGLRRIRFGTDGVSVEEVPGEPLLPRRLGERLMLFFTGISRQSSTVLAEQRANIEDRRPTLRAMRELAEQGCEALAEGRLDEFGALIDESWQLKRGLASRITSDEIDAIYSTARRAGAIGGKISGAGGGGFLLLYCPPERHEAVRCALHGLAELEFGLEPMGSTVLLNSRH
jgi:D-glycero-alpha-D-manno-heptose-7-phosphate kinase